jgi:hypothetical protein
MTRSITRFEIKAGIAALAILAQLVPGLFSSTAAAGTSLDTTEGKANVLHAQDAFVPELQPRRIIRILPADVPGTLGTIVFGTDDGMTPPIFVRGPR